MTDGVTLNPGSGGSVVDTEAVGLSGSHIQRVKIVTGARDTDGGDVATANGLPVTPATGAAWSVTGTFWQATQPVSWSGQSVSISGNVTLGAGAATIGSISNTSFGISGTLPAFASTPTVNLGTLNGAALASNQPTNAAQASTTSGQTGALAMAAAVTGAPSLTNGQTYPLYLDASGNLRVNVVAGGGSGGTSSTFGTSFPGTGTAAGAQYLSSPPTLTNAQMNALLLDVNGNLKVNVAAGGGSGGTSSNFAAAFPGTGTAIGAKNGANMVSLAADGSGNLQVNLQTALPAGANTIGAVTQSGGPWTVSWSGQTVATNADASIGAGTAPSKALVAGGVYNSTPPTLTNGQTAALQLNASGAQKVDGSAVTQPVSGTFWQATQPVSIAATVSVSWSGQTVGLVAGSAIIGKVGIDQTTPGTTNGVQINAALPAGANTIGAVTQASGPWTVNHTQLAGSALGAPSTWGSSPGAVAVQGVNANVLAMPSLPAGANTIGAVTQSGGPWSVSWSGQTVATNADASIGAGAAPSKALIAGGVYNSTPPTLTNGQTAALQLNASGAQKVDGSAVTQPVSGTFWQATQPVSLASLPALVAGSAIIGKVGIDQTTPGTTNGVQVNAALPAGSNTIGNVGVNNKPVGAASFTPFRNNSVSSSSATQLVAARTGAVGTGRVSVTILNNGTVALELGNSGVTYGAGIPLSVGASTTLDLTSAIYAIAASGTGSAAGWESY